MAARKPIRKANMNRGGTMNKAPKTGSRPQAGAGRPPAKKPAPGQTTRGGTPVRKMVGKAAARRRRGGR